MISEPATVRNGRIQAPETSDDPLLSDQPTIELVVKARGETGWRWKPYCSGACRP